MAADSATATMGGDLRELWWVPLIQGIVAIILGILFLTYPGATAATVAGMVGFFWLIGGIMDFVAMFMNRANLGWKLFGGIVGVLAGLVVLSNIFKHPLWTALALGGVYVLVLGIQGIVIGVVQLVRAFQGDGWGVGILGVLSVLFGLLLVFNPLAGALALPWVFGVLGIVFGGIGIFWAFRIKNA
jgi:uncharacterized membrane protein HdeD (DUF308 family)